MNGNRLQVRQIVSEHSLRQVYLSERMMRNNLA